MTAQENKTELSLTIDDAVRFFRGVAEALATGDDKSLADFGLALRDARKMKFEVKRSSDALTLQVKIKNRSQNLAQRSEEQGSGPEDQGGRSGYKAVKKRLERSYKAIRKSLLAGDPPDPAIIAGFLADSEMMVGYPGYGDPCYPAYAAACKEVEKAAGTGLEEMRKAFKAVADLKSACHDRFR